MDPNFKPPVAVVPSRLVLVCTQNQVQVPSKEEELLGLKASEVRELHRVFLTLVVLDVSVWRCVALKSRPHI